MRHRPTALDSRRSGWNAWLISKRYLKSLLASMVFHFMRCNVDGARHFFALERFFNSPGVQMVLEQRPCFLYPLSVSQFLCKEMLSPTLLAIAFLCKETLGGSISSQRNVRR